MGFFDRDVYGQAALVEAIEGIEFPISKYQLMNEVGDRGVQWFKDGEPLKLREIIEKLDYAMFSSPAELLEAVSDQIRVI